MRCHAGAAALLLLTPILAPTLARAESAALRIPGTGVSLTPPDGFVLADEFPGLKHPDTESSIMVTEMPFPADTLRASLTPERAAERGMVISDTETVELAGQEGSLYSIVQNVQGNVYQKWMAVFGSEEETVMVVATFLEKHASEMSAPTRAALLSVSWSPDATQDPFEGLSFRIDESPRLEIAQRVSNMLILNLSGEIAEGEPSEAMMIVGSSFEASVGDLEEFSRRRLKMMDGVVDVGDFQGREITVADHAAYELTASGTDEDSEAPLALYQVIVPAGDVYYIAYGQVGAADAAEYLPEFRQVAQSLSLTNP